MTDTQALEIIKQALNVAMLKGAYDLQAAANVIEALKHLVDKHNENELAKSESGKNSNES